MDGQGKATRAPAIDDHKVAAENRSTVAEFRVLDGGWSLGAAEHAETCRGDEEARRNVADRLPHTGVCRGGRSSAHGGVLRGSRKLTAEHRPARDRRKN